MNRHTCLGRRGIVLGLSNCLQSPASGVRCHSEGVSGGIQTDEHVRVFVKTEQGGSPVVLPRLQLGGDRLYIGKYAISSRRLPMINGCSMLLCQTRELVCTPFGRTVGWWV